MQKIVLQDRVVLPDAVKHQFGTLFLNIRQSDKTSRSICVTAGDEKQGTSFVAYQLASEIAGAGKKVILLDCNMRKPSLYTSLGYEKEVLGLSDILNMKISPSKGLYQTSKKNLFLMPTGTIPENPGLLYRKMVFSELLASLYSIVDYIIIDTPDMTLSSDAITIAGISDASLMVVASGEFSKETGRECVTKLKQSSRNFLGVVLNKYQEEEE